MSIGIDVGGTFTDLVSVAPDAPVQTAKVLSTPHDQSAGVIHALGVHDAPPRTVERIVHGTTVVTNMLLERRGARVVLCATAGATDLLELRRQERASLYDLSAHHPAPLVSSECVVAVDERIEPSGVRRALTADAARQVADRVAALAPDIVAVTLLHAYADASHERQLADAIAGRLPGIDVVCSSEVLPEIREFERAATTTCEAYVRPGVARYLARLAEELQARALPAPGIVTSSGGMNTANDAARAAASLALSGPAGGVAGAALVARAVGVQRALSIDIGGTSADVGLIVDGEPLVEAGGAVAGIPIALPRVLVETVSAGGGSIGWIDEGGALRAGPQSAGAVPGPVAFGGGGSQPTVTDAHVALGHIRAGLLRESVQINADAARNAIGALAARLGASAERTAAALIATADAAMARALRRVSVERGIDPRTCVLIAFGGGGPLHACGLAERLGITRVLVPPHAGVLSALGLAVAPERRVAMRSVMRSLDAVSTGTLAEVAETLAAHTGTGGEIAWIARLRYAGQGHELEVPFAPGTTPHALAERFAAMHRTRYGFTLDLGVEIVSARCIRSGDAREARLARQAPSRWNGAEARDDGGAFDATVHGPRAVTLPDATMLVAPGWTARALPLGGWELWA